MQSLEGVRLDGVEVVLFFQRILRRRFLKLTPPGLLGVSNRAPADPKPDFVNGYGELWRPMTRKLVTEGLSKEDPKTG